MQHIRKSLETASTRYKCKIHRHIYTTHTIGRYMMWQWTMLDLAWDTDNAKKYKLKRMQQNEKYADSESSIQI